MLTNRQLFLQHLGQTSTAPLMLEIVKADGIRMYDISGRVYLDLISGVSVSNTGHRHPDVIRAIKAQIDSYLHLMVYGEMIQSPQVKYATRLAELLPPELKSVYFVNSGSEAVEGALKLAKRFTGRTKLIYFRNSYHGSTHGALSIQGSELYKNDFRPLLPDTIQADFNDPDSASLIDDQTACVILEPVQAEAGVILPEPGFLETLRKKCTEKGAMLIFDEVQTAFGRTGSLFAFEKTGVVPDILVLAKALGGGMPLGAFISSRAIMSSLVKDPQLGHITTFGGHPVCCAAGLASLEVILGEGLTESASHKSELFRELLKHDLVTQIRGEGLLLAVKMEKPAHVSYIVANAPRHGLILDYFLFCNDSFRIAPPLIISDDEIKEACSRLLSLIDETQMNARE
ncbi:MAG TPA: aspartate aminotransferase family protein [Bacteroidales bacterium]|nr:aspartate aminotransferase family protein [Bacteroidales bacterium]HPF03448.1 aspartate aminotransferase family protein [Bacteroidales bacterium]HPR11018.1 aspartate aminotransferase family protein [Bacteroidales bacterium]HRW84455.1 aspartate aminotransferase family protein [Bacteroidales bacterium]